MIAAHVDRQLTGCQSGVAGTIDGTGPSGHLASAAGIAVNLDVVEWPRIEIAVRESDGKVVLALRDHGSGIDPNQIGRIFDPFFTTKDVGKGLGLGLSISYNIVKDFEGAIRAENHPDGGALFTVELPLLPAPAPVLEPA